MTREQEVARLAGMAMCFQANTGKMPATVKELVECWELGGMYKTLDEIAEHEDTDHIPECLWLRELVKRPDAPELFAEALKQDARSPTSNTEHVFKDTNRHLVEVPDSFAIARWPRDADIATIARCILGTLKYEPHTADTTPLRRALENLIADLTPAAFAKEYRAPPERGA